MSQLDLKIGPKIKAFRRQLGIQANKLAEQFTGIPGALVDIKDTIKGFNMIMDGELDHIPESAFNLKGKIEEAIEEGEKMLSEAK